ncbi:MAG: DUF1616 domain-containing protein [Thermoplasmata archaeon]
MEIHTDEKPWDLLVVVLLTGILIPIIVFAPDSVLRPVLGLPFLLFFPGYALISSLFPEEQGLDHVERLALSFGLSIALTPLVGLLLNYVWNITLTSILTSLSVLILCLCALSYLRRISIPQEERFDVNINIEQPNWSEYDTIDKLLAVGTVVLLISSVVLAAYIITTPRTGERFTDFYVLGPGGMADDYPTSLSINQSGHVILGTVNREHRDMDYHMVIRAASTNYESHQDLEDEGDIETGLEIFFDSQNMTDEEIPEDYNMTLSPSTTYFTGFTLSHEEKFTKHLNYTLEEPGLYMVQFLLFRTEEFTLDDTEPYRNLHLWVTVTEEG